MKSLKVIVLGILCTFAIAARADYFCSPVSNNHKPTLEEPFTEVDFTIGDLHGVDYVWLRGPKIYVNGKYMYDGNALREFHDENGESGTNQMKNEELAKNDDYIIVLERIYRMGGDWGHPTARIRIYNRKEPYKGVKVKIEGRYGYWDKSSNNRSYEETTKDGDKSDFDVLKCSSYSLFYVGPKKIKYVPKYDVKSSWDREVTLKATNGNTVTKTVTSGGEIFMDLTGDPKWLLTGQTVSFYTNVTDGNHFTYKLSDEVGKIEKYEAPSKISITPDKWQRADTLRWSMSSSDYVKKHATSGSSDPYYGKLYIYRREKNANAKWTLIKENLSLDATTFTDKNDLEYGKTYEYSICFYPQCWLTSSGKGGNTNPADGPLDQMQATGKVDIKHGSPNIRTTTEAADKSIKVKWTHAPIPTTIDGNRPEFVVYRKTKDESAWTQLQEVKITNPSSTCDSIIDANTQALEEYSYKVDLVYGNVTEQGTPTVSYASITGVTKVLTVTASKGTYKDHTIIDWTVDQVGTEATKFNVMKREKGSLVWSTIATLTGTSDEYSYTDVTCESGHYYQYAVQPASINKDGKIVNGEAKYTYGFAQSLGVISGQVTYSGGQGVDSVRVYLTPNNEVDGDFYYSLDIPETSTGAKIKLGQTEGEAFQNVITDNAEFTVAMWARLDQGNGGLLAFDNKSALSVRNSKLYIYETSTTITVPEGQWTYFFFTKNAQGIEAGIISDGEIIKQLVSSSESYASVKTMSVGNQKTGAVSGQIFLDEVRVFNPGLSDVDNMRYYDRMLSGNEKGLRLYWPINEGVSMGTIFDMSNTNSVTNNAHGELGDEISYTTDSPNDAGAIGCYGLTDINGSYTISGIPFAGNGTNYTITPSKSTHEFSSSKLTRYISSSSLVYSGVDFTDNSSFAVKGTVLYKGTTIPVEKCNFEVDGVLCANSNNQAIESAADGTFTINVPIGTHKIVVKKNNHVFVGGGLYSGTFLKETENLEFTDSTLVNFVGRIVGGFRDKNQPIGFNQSVNNIGKAKFELSLEDDRYWINAKTEESSTTYVRNPNTERVEVSSDTASIASHAYKGFGSVEEVRKVYVETDSLNGEFSVMLPPVKYKMSVAELVSDASVQIGQVQSIDLSDFTKATADTLSGALDSTTMKRPVLGTYKYQSKYVADYHTTPVFTVKQAGKDAFGSEEYTGNTLEKTYTVKTYETGSDGKINYRYGYPIFITGQEYDFDIEAYESYVNADAKAKNPSVEAEQQPLEGCFVQIANALSSTQRIVSKASTVDGKEYKEGDAYGENLNGVCLDKFGQATYTWCAGLPNVNAETNFARSITMSLNISGKSTKWVPTANQNIAHRADGTADGAGMMAVNAGSINMGNDFVTNGPDKVLMVLRDPPGAKSSVTWKSGSTITRKHESLAGGGAHNKNIVTNCYGSDLTTIYGTATVALEGAIVETEIKNNVGGGIEFTSARYDGDISTDVITTTEDISTESTAEYVGSDGDLYIGTGRNIIFGQARQVYLPEEGNEVAVRDATGARDSVTTAFHYSQKYIINTLLPKFEDMKADILEPMSAKLSPSEVKKPHYYTNYKKGDKEFGTSNVSSIWGDKAGTTSSENDCVITGPSYTIVFPATPGNYNDTIAVINNNELLWQNVILANEREKVEMYEDRNSSDVHVDNVTFDGGSKDVRTYTTTHTNSSYQNWQNDQEAYFVWKTGTLLNHAGVNMDESANHISKETVTNTQTSDTTSTFIITLADNSNCSHTVDIYRGTTEDEDGKTQVCSTSKNGWGPIFRTLGGQTYGPYEDGDSTIYYQKGTEIMAKTLQMEVPQLIIDEPLQENIPNGGTASFKIKMSNQSHANSNATFSLGYDVTSNKNNAKLTIDGMALNGVKFYIPYNTTIEKTIQLTQTDKSVLRYDDIKISLSSINQASINSSVNISAHFVPTSPKIDLEMATTVINTSSKSEAVDFVLKDIDTQYSGLKSIVLQYQYGSSSEWVAAHTWVTGTPSGTEESLKDCVTAGGGQIKYSYDLHGKADGDYTFRIMSITQYGNDDDVKNFSDGIKVTKDMERPQLITAASPSDGILGIGSEISAEFNEDIATGKLSHDGNFEVYGTLQENDKAMHSVCLQSTTYNSIETKNRMDLSNRAFTAEFWFQAMDESGVLLSFAPTKDYPFLLCYLEGVPTLMANFNNNMGSLKASVTVPDVKGKWVFYQMTYTPKDNTSDKNYLSLTMVADGMDAIKALDNVEVPDIPDGKLYVGLASEGLYSDLAIWDGIRTWEEAVESMNKSKTGRESDLIHYWPMNEGNGNVAEDLTSGNNFILSDNSWHFSGTNYSANVKNAETLSIPFGDSNLNDNDSYTVEFWYNESGHSTLNNTHIFHDEAEGVDISQDQDRHIVLTTKRNGETKTMISESTFDYGWHHVALSVQRGISANLYVDGTRQIELSEKNVPTIAGSSLFIGSGYDGDIDEIRIWRGIISKDYLDDQRFCKIDTANAEGLIRYYPFECTSLDENKQLMKTFSLHNALEANDVTLHDMTGNATQGLTSAPLKDALVRTNISYTFAASDRKIKITIPDSELAKLEGTKVNIVLKNVEDANGNISTPLMWDAYVRRNPLRWEDSETETVRADVGFITTFSKTIENKGGNSVNWELDLPTWLSASPSNGTLSPEGKQTITFTTSANIPTGRYSGTVELINLSNDIAEKQSVVLQVLGVEPIWEVDYTNKDYRIPLTAQLIKNKTYSDNENDVIAAFAGDECVGVGHLQYNNDRGAYYANITLYGNEELNNTPLTFKAWDSENDLIYSPLTRKAEGSLILSSEAEPFGTYSNPEILYTGETIEQTISLNEGWNWISFYLNTGSVSITDAVGKAGSLIPVIKTNTGSVMWNEGDGNSAAGYYGNQLTSLNENTMYAIKSTDYVTITVVGKPLTNEECNTTIKKNWNWIRNPYTYNQSLASAFAGFAPVNGDVLQGEDDYAIWGADINRWEGTRTNFQPGAGYKYFSKDENEKSLFFEDATTASSPVRKVSSKPTSITDYGYQSNMTMLATLVLSDNENVDLDTVRIEAVNDNQETFQTLPDRGYYIFTLAGPENSEFTFSANINGKNRTLYPIVMDENQEEMSTTVTYTPDSIIGSFKAPLILSDTNAATGIANIGMGESEGNYSVYSISGMHLFDGKNNADKLKALPEGMYIINGKKTVVKK